MEACDQVKVSDAQQAQQTAGIHRLGDVIGCTVSETLRAIAPPRLDGQNDDREGLAARIITFGEVIERVGDLTVDADPSAGKLCREAPFHEAARGILERVYVDDPLYHEPQFSGFDCIQLGSFFHYPMIDQSAIIHDF